MCGSCYRVPTICSSCSRPGHFSLSRELQDIVPGTPEPHNCSKLKSKVAFLFKKIVVVIWIWKNPQSWNTATSTAKDLPHFGVPIVCVKFSCYYVSIRNNCCEFYTSNGTEFQSSCSYFFYTSLLFLLFQFYVMTSTKIWTNFFSILIKPIRHEKRFN